MDIDFRKITKVTDDLGRNIVRIREVEHNNKIIWELKDNYVDMGLKYKTSESGCNSYSDGYAFMQYDPKTGSFINLDDLFEEKLAKGFTKFTIQFLHPDVPKMFPSHMASIYAATPHILKFGLDANSAWRDDFYTSTTWDDPSLTVETKSIIGGCTGKTYGGCRVLTVYSLPEIEVPIPTSDQKKISSDIWRLRMVNGYDGIAIRRDMTFWTYNSSNVCLSGTDPELTAIRMTFLK